MLSRVKIQNFKSIGEPGVDLELKPLTFLVGPNGGGKSSILEAIGVEAQQGLTGRLVQFRSQEDVVHKPHGEESVLEVYFDDSPASWRTLVSSHSISRQERWDGATNPTSQHARLLNNLAQHLLSDSFLISSVRGSVPYDVDTRGSPEWVGLQGEDLLLLLARIFSQRQHDEVAVVIAKWAGRFGIDGLKAGLWGRNIAGSDYLDPQLKVALNLALASSGARQMLTVITQLFWARKGSLLMIEEPEISLHPKAQLDVMEMFAKAINKQDKQIIATTHSLFMMQAIGYAVNKGWLTADQVAVHDIEKRKGTGTVAKQLPVKQTGYIKGWVPSFARVERQLLREWAKTLPKE